MAGKPVATIAGGSLSCQESRGTKSFLKNEKNIPIQKFAHRVSETSCAKNKILGDSSTDATRTGHVRTTIAQFLVFRERFF